MPEALALPSPCIPTYNAATGRLAPGLIALYGVPAASFSPSSPGDATPRQDCHDGLLRPLDTRGDQKCYTSEQARLLILYYCCTDHENIHGFFVQPLTDRCATTKTPLGFSSTIDKTMCDHENIHGFFSNH